MKFYHCISITHQPKDQKGQVRKDYFYVLQNFVSWKFEMLVSLAKLAKNVNNLPLEFAILRAIQGVW